MEPSGTSSGASSDPSQYRADWYPDPTLRFEFRYHNGRDWTGDVSVDGNRFLDPLPRPAVGPAAPGKAPVAPGPASGAFGAAQPTRTGKATAAMVLGIGSVVAGWVPFVFVLAAAAAILALVFGIPALRRARHEQPVNRRARAFALTGVILAPIGLALCGVGWQLSVLALREVDRFTNVGPYSIDETSCVVNDGVATFSGTITNRSNQTRSYHVSVEFLRPGTSNPLHRASADVDGVGADQTESWSVSVVVDEETLDCEIATVSGPLPFNQD